MNPGRHYLWIRLSVLLLLLLIAVPLSAQSRGRSRTGVRGKNPFPAIQLTGPMRGEQAIQALGARLPEVAEWYGKSTSELARLLRSDLSLWVTRSGRLMYACELEVPLGAASSYP